MIATALYFIDYLALRVGNEKGADEADTVGVSSLRVEHVKLGPENSVTLDFLGKDSIRYTKTITVDDIVYSNLQEFSKNKSPEDDLFDKMRSTDLNKYLQDFMPGLTAKVFRTFNASSLFQKELNNVSKKMDNKVDTQGQTGEVAQDIKKIDETLKVATLLDGLNHANIKVALLCNHQKQVSKTFDTQISKIKTRVKDVKKKLVKLKTEYKNSESTSAVAKKKRSQIKKTKADLQKLKNQLAIKVQLKNISLETSKVNYIDPRIAVGFMKKHKIPIDQFYNKTLQSKFWWAFDVDDTYNF